MKLFNCDYSTQEIRCDICVQPLNKRLKSSENITFKTCDICEEAIKNAKEQREFEMTKKELNKLDKKVNTLYMQHCCNIQVDMMDLSKIFDVGRKALLDGLNDEDAGKQILDFVNSIKKN